MGNIAENEKITSTMFQIAPITSGGNQITHTLNSMSDITIHTFGDVIISQKQKPKDDIVPKQKPFTDAHGEGAGNGKTY